MAMEVALLTLAALVLALVAFVAVWRWRLSRLRLSVTVETLPHGSDSAHATHARISATNVGRGKIAVAALTLEFPGANTLADCLVALPDCPATPLPAKLAPGETAQAVVDLWSISGRLWDIGARTECKLYGRCDDPTGRTYRSAAWPFVPRYPRGAEASSSLKGLA